MKKRSNVIVNFLYNSVYQVLLIILPLMTSPYISRVLKSEGIGLYSYTYSIASVFAMIGLLGVNNYGSRAIAVCLNDKRKRSTCFWNIFAVKGFASLFALIVYIFYVILVCPDSYKIVAYVQIITILTSFFDINWFFFGIEKFKLTVTRSTIIKVMTVVLVFVLVKDENDVLIYTLLAISGNFISNIIIWPFLKSEVSFVKPTWSEMKGHIPQLLILFIPVLAISVYNKMDKIMLGWMSTFSQNGYYENTERIINIPFGVITALGTVMLPRMSSLYSEGNNKQTKKYLELSMEFVTFLGSAMTFGIASIAPEFSPIFFGNGYDGVEMLIILISPTILIKAWANVIRTQYLIPLHYDKVYVVSVCLGAVVNLIVNTILIPKYAAVGAVIGTIFAEFVVMIYQTAFVAKYLTVFKYLKQGGYYVLMGSAMFVVVRIIANMVRLNVIGLILETCVGAIAYIVLCFPYVYVRHRDTLRKMLRR